MRRAPEPPTPRGETGLRGLKGVPASVPQGGYFGRNRRKSVETAQPMRQKAIQGLLSRFRWSRTTSIFDVSLPVLNRALSALFFSESDLNKSKIPPPQGGSQYARGVNCNYPLGRHEIALGLGDCPDKTPAVFLNTLLTH